MKKLSILFCFTFFVSVIQAQEPTAYKLYNAEGEEVDYSAVISEFKNMDVVLLGELHNDPISHWMHLEIIQSLHQETPNTVLGAEMFERDNQLLLDEYLSRKIREKDFEKEARLWPNYETDYKPFVEYAYDNKLSFIATNVPRRYAAAVAREGTDALDSLSDEALDYLPPLPYHFNPEAPEYAEMLQMMSGQHGGGDNMVKAQALKDATMAHFIAQNLPDDGLFIHIQGDYHSKNYGSIYRYLLRHDQNLNIGTFSTVTRDNGKWSEDFKGRADFILVVTEQMTKTH